MSRRERVMRVALSGVGMGLVTSLLRGRLWTVTMLWEIAFWTALFALLSPLDSFFQRRRKAKRL